MNIKLPQIILTILILVFLGQIVYLYPQLPETIASHFNASGQADGFASKVSFFIFEGVLVVVLLSVFLSMSKILSKLPVSAINLPNKDYWLSPDRSEQTFAAFRGFFTWLSVIIVGLFIAINQIALTANVMKKDPSVTQFWISLGIFFVMDAVLIFIYLRRFFGTKKV